MKLSKRLQAIACYTDILDSVCDVGCDHGYLDIFFALNGYKNIIASDISENVISFTKKNFEKYNVSDKIKVYCTDGTKNIDDYYDTLIISGMGANTILNILKDSKICKKIIIESNNDWELVRRKVIKLGYYLADEKIIKDGKKVYDIMLFKKGFKKLSTIEKRIGLFNKNSLDEYKILKDNYQKIYKKIPRKYIFKKLNMKYKIKNLELYLKKIDN